MRCFNEKIIWYAIILEQVAENFPLIKLCSTIDSVELGV